MMEQVLKRVTFKWTFLGLFFLIFQTEIISQNYLWSKSIGGKSHDGIANIVTDQAGNVFVYGGFRDTVDFDQGPGVASLVSVNSSVSNLNGDIFVAKYDSSGNFIWVKHVANSLALFAASIGMDLNGNIILSGVFQGTIDVNPNGFGVYNLTSVGYLSNIFVVKLDNNGDFIWAQSMGEMGCALMLTGLITDSSDNIYLTGSYSAFGVPVDLDPGPGTLFLPATAGNNGFVAKFNAFLQPIWAKTYIPSSSSSYVNSATVDKYGNVYLTGSFQITVDLDPGPGSYTVSSSGSTNGFITKLNSQGSFIWGKVINSTSYAVLGSIQVDNVDNVVVAGYFRGVVDFDPSPAVVSYTAINSYYSDSFVCKFDSAGNFNWVKVFGGPKHDECYAMKVDANANIYISGEFAETIDFDPGPGTFTLSSQSMYQGYLLKLDVGGNFIWVKPVKEADSLSMGYGVSIHEDVQGNMYFLGQYFRTVDLNPDMGSLNNTSNGGIDLFIIKLGACRIELDAGPDRLVCAGESAALTATGPYAFLWEPGFGFNSTILVSPQSTTSYSLVAYLDGNCFKSDEIIVTVDVCTGMTLNQFADVNSMMVFPNPSNGNFVVRGVENNIVRIISASGQVVETLNLLEQQNYSAEVAHLEKGIYFLVTPKANKKIIVE